MLAQRRLFTYQSALLLVVLPLVVAHGDEHGSTTMMSMGSHGHMDHSAAASKQTIAAEPLAPTYFNHSEYSGWILAHILLMILAWVIILPIAVFISSIRSKLAIPVQALFLVTNTVGIFTSIVYDSNTPDLYPNNAHHKIGWAVSWIAGVWIALGLLDLFSNRDSAPHTGAGSHPISHDSMAEHNNLHGFKGRRMNSWSHDSGHGTEEPSSAGSSRGMSTELAAHKLEDARPLLDGDDHNDDHDTHTHIPEPRTQHFMTRRMPRLQSGPLLTSIKVIHVVLERAQLLLGFLAFCTGLITWWGIFHENLLNGLAHWIKGGIFFWYGLLTLGRWMGAFADWGWAWNQKPDHPVVSRLAARVPTAEFVESLVICAYGASNVFLEHLGATDANPGWTPADLEHVSITIMFFGGGMLGMLVESAVVRRLLSSSSVELARRHAHHPNEEEEEQRRVPEAQHRGTSLNPLPALVIFLLGLMMSSHHQDSMVATMVHAQWGTLFAGFAAARLLTYLLQYLRPPASIFPSRPPTELLASFCLVCGGLVFMASTRDVVDMIERNGLHAMMVLTVTVGLSCLVMVWVLVLYAIRGWALRRQHALTFA